MKRWRKRNDSRDSTAESVKLRIPIEELAVGMFVDADVLSILKEAEIRHFLDLRDATYREQTTRRMRLKKKRHEQVAFAGGMLLGSQKELEALLDIGLLELTIDTDKSDVVPDVQELKEEKARRDSGDDDVDIDSLDESVSLSASTADVETPQRARRIDAGSTERRRNFGPANSGWMKVEVDREEAEGILQVISFGGDASLTEDDIVECLNNEYGMTNKLDDEMIRRLAKQAASAPNRVIRGHFTIARELELDPSAIGEIEYTCLEDVPADTALQYGELKEAFSRRTLSEVMGNPLPVRVVMPGEELAVFITDDEDGLEDATPDALLRVGENVQLMDGRYMSTVHGYVCIIADEISVIPPIWVSPDFMDAHYIRFPHVGPEPMLTKEWLHQVLDHKEVRFGFSEDEIDRLLEEPVGEASSIILARGTPPQVGSDATLYLPFEKPRGVVEENGGGKVSESMTRYDAAMVTSNEMLAELTSASEGSPGQDVTGRECGVSPGADITLMAGDNVRTEERGQRKYFYAETEGRAHVKNQVLSVRTVSYIDRDVEGHLEIEAGKDVRIRGSVRSGAVLTGSGSIAIEGVVEGGAKIEAEDDVVVAKGIIGRETQVVSRGRVEAGFVQYASLVAKDDVTITDYLVNAQVKTGGILKISGEGESDRSGTAVGGEIIASGGIVARRIDSARAPTTLAVGPNPQISERLEKADQAVEFCRKNMLRIFRTLGISEIDATQFKRLIESSPPHRRKPIMELLNQLKVLVARRSESLNQKKELKDEQEQAYEKVEIRVEEGIEADVQIRIGDKALTLAEALSGTVFRREGDEIMAEEV